MNVKQNNIVPDSPRSAMTVLTHLQSTVIQTYCKNLPVDMCKNRSSQYQRVYAGLWQACCTYPFKLLCGRGLYGSAILPGVYTYL